MRIAYVTIGPQGSGKTTFCKKIVKGMPSVHYVSRDKILMQMFGSVYTNPYDGSYEYAIHSMWKKIKNILNKNKKECRLILDTWNGYASTRGNIVRDLRSLGVDLVYGWYFFVDTDKCVEWFFSKKSEDKMTFSESSCRHNHRLYYSQPVEGDYSDTDSGKYFDSVVKINPLQLTLVPLHKLYITP